MHNKLIIRMFRAEGRILRRMRAQQEQPTCILILNRMVRDE